VLAVLHDGVGSWVGVASPLTCPVDP